MEIACQIFNCGVVLIFGSLAAGFIETWWEERRKRQEQERYERFMQKLSENCH